MKRRGRTDQCLSVAPSSIYVLPATKKKLSSTIEQDSPTAMIKIQQMCGLRLKKAPHNIH